MPKPSLIGCVIAVLIAAGTLSAQPDPVLNCRKRAAALINATVANTSARQRGGLDSGDVIILWQANLPNNHVVAGFCEARPTSFSTSAVSSARNMSSTQRMPRESYIGISSQRTF
jgi:hypothetical protein